MPGVHVAQIARTIQPGGLGAYEEADNRSDLSKEQEEAGVAVMSVEKKERKEARDDNIMRSDGRRLSACETHDDATDTAAEE